MPRVNLKQIAYNAIKDNIINCRYEPSSFLNEEQLCLELGMSRTPVRDALGRLEQEGLLKILPKKGFIITPLSIQDINMVYEVRMLLEPFIISNYCGHMSPESLQELQNCYQMEKLCLEDPAQLPAGVETDPYYWDNEFHHCMMKQCPNTYFLRILDDVQSQNARIRISSGTSSNQRLKETLEEHLGILEALEKGDADQAAEMIKTHMQNGRSSSFRILTSGMRQE